MFSNTKGTILLIVLLCFLIFGLTACTGADGTSLFTANSVTVDGISVDVSGLASLSIDPTAITIDGSKVSIRQNTSFTKSQFFDALSVATTKSDGSEGTNIPLSGIEVDWGTFANTSIAGEYPIKITYTENGETYETEFTLVVTAAAVLTDARLSGQKTTFAYNEPFDLGELAVTKIWSDGTETATSSNEYDLDSSAFRKGVAGTYEIKLSFKYLDITKSYTVTINPRPAPIPLSVSWFGYNPNNKRTTDPATANYYKGETIDKNARLRIVYDYNAFDLTQTGRHNADIYVARELEAESPRIGIEGFDTSTEGEKTVRIYLLADRTKYVEFDITVVTANVYVQRFEITTEPTKTVYDVSDSADWSGFRATLHYTDGSTETLTDEAIGVSISVEGFETALTAPSFELKTLEFTYTPSQATASNAVLSDTLQIMVEPKITAFRYTSNAYGTAQGNPARYPVASEVNFGTLAVEAEWNDANTAYSNISHKKGLVRYTLQTEYVAENSALGFSLFESDTAHVGASVTISLKETAFSLTYYYGVYSRVVKAEQCGWTPDGIAEKSVSKTTYNGNDKQDGRIPISIAYGESTASVRIFTDYEAFDVPLNDARISLHNETADLGAEVCVDYSGCAYGADQTILVIYTDESNVDGVVVKTFKVKYSPLPTAIGFVEGTEPLGVYFLNATENWYAVEVYVSYADDTEHRISLSEDMEADEPLLSVGAVVTSSVGQNLTSTISLRSHTYIKFTYTYSVVEKQLDTVTILHGPTKTKYLYGEAVDISGLRLTATFDDGSSEIINATNGCIDVVGFDSTTNVARGAKELERLVYFKLSNTDTLSSGFTYTLSDYQTDFSVTTAPTREHTVDDERIYLDGIVYSVTWASSSIPETGTSVSAVCTNDVLNKTAAGVYNFTVKLVDTSLTAQSSYRVIERTSVSISGGKQVYLLGEEYSSVGIQLTVIGDFSGTNVYEGTDIEPIGEAANTFDTATATATDAHRQYALCVVGTEYSADYEYRVATLGSVSFAVQPTVSAFEYNKSYNKTAIMNGSQLLIGYAFADGTAYGTPLALTLDDSTTADDWAKITVTDFSTAVPISDAECTVSYTLHTAQKTCKLSYSVYDY